MPNDIPHYAHIVHYHIANDMEIRGSRSSVATSIMLSPNITAAFQNLPSVADLFSQARVPVASFIFA